MITSKALILTICSNTKIAEGEQREYSAISSIASLLDEPASKNLYEGRRQIRGLITGGEVSRDGKRLRELPYNSSLQNGPDFQLRGLSQGGMYLPAGKRYRGKFYTEIDPDGTSLLQAQHHILIISGLYGLLLPSEPTQLYSCHIPDHDAISKTWQERERLTAAVVNYIEKFRITKVFDFTAVEAYRRLISWTEIRNATNGEVLHSFSKQFAGDPLLRPLGAITKMFLSLPENELLKIKSGDSEKTPYGEVVFLSVSVPQTPDIAKEIERKKEVLTTNDKLGRMRRNVIKVLNNVPYLKNEVDFGERIGALKDRHEHRIGHLLDEFADKRNAVEYDGYEISQEDWKKISHAYNEVMKWAKANGFSHGVSLENVQ